MSTNAIPLMTDPLGRHWDQPHDIRQAPMDDTHVLLSSSQVKELKDYSHSIPTGAYEGKCWKLRGENEWHLAWYAPHANPGLIGIQYRAILEVME